MVRIRAIGRAEVQLGRSRIRPDSQMLFAFALYLGLTAGERISRAHLLDVFWSGVEDGPRRHALRQLLYRLRRSGLTLESDGDELLLDRKQVDSDLGPMLEPTWPDNASADDVIAAASVLPGYMPPMPPLYREWLDGVRARVGAQFRRAALRQIESARAEGRWVDVEEWARRCLDADPLNEEATLARAEVLMMAGSKSRAQLLLDDYLWELGDRQKVIGLPAKLLRRRISELGEPAAATRFDSVPLVGRSAEVASLNQTLATTLTGRSAAVMVVGVPGIGKSAVAQQLLTSSGMRGWRSVVVGLQPSDRHRPLALFVDLFSAMLRMPGALGCDPASLTQLQRLTEHAVHDESASQKSQEAEAVQDRIRAAAVDLLGAVCDEGPLVVLLEDLHWIDDESTRLLQHLVAQSRDLPLLWLMTARPEARYAPLREALPDELVRGIRLGPLPPTDAITLYRALANGAGPLDETIVREIADGVTGGNPLFIREVAQHVAHTGSAASLPSSLRALIRDRVERLQPLAQHVLDTCAVLGRYSSVPRVASVLEIGTAGLLACIDELAALGILGAGEGANALALHDLWQEELLSSLKPASRQLLHHRCGEVLEEESRGTRSAAMVWEAARHFQASGAHRRALNMLEECAQHLLENGMPVEAAETFELAFAASATDEERLRTLSGRITALHGAGFWTQLGPLVEQAIALSNRSAAGHSRHSDLELLQTEILWRTQADPQGSLDHALLCAFDNAASPRHRARAALIAATTSSHLARYAELTRVHGEIAAIQCSDPEDRALLLGVATIYHTELGSLDAAAEFAERRIAIERELGSVSGLARALGFAVVPFRYLGEFERAMHLARESLDLLERHHIFGSTAYAADVLSGLFLERDDVPAAREWLDHAERLASRAGAPYMRDSLNIARAVFSLGDGDLHAAEALMGDDVAHYAQLPTVRERLLKLSVLTRLFASRIRRDGLEDAVRLVRQGLDLAGMTGRYDYIVASYAVGLSALGSASEARSYVRNYCCSIRRERSKPGRELQAYLDS
jgi:DNA-binding SARP family transcriptional activator/tetratricopeptide (TPR) repeat protein